MKNALGLIILILSISLIQCSSPQKNGKPEKLIPKEQIVLILADMQITEAYLDELKMPGNMLKDSSLLYYDRIFRKNQITQLEFEESLLYYKQDLVDLENIYTQVITRLSELKAKNEELLLEMKADSIRQDSIRKAKIIQDSLQKIQQKIDSLQQLENSKDSLHITNDSIFVK